MKKSFLACSILLAAAGCSAEQGGLAAASSEAITARADLEGDTFLSTDTYAYRTYEGTTVQAKLRLKFIPADSYGLDDAYNTGLDYEVTVEWVDAATGRAWGLDSTFFARKGSKSAKYDFFDCDSSRNCSTGYMTDLTVDGTDAALTNSHLLSIFYGVTDAPAVVNLAQVK